MLENLMTGEAQVDLISENTWTAEIRSTMNPNTIVPWSQLPLANLQEPMDRQQEHTKLNPGQTQFSEPIAPWDSRYDMYGKIDPNAIPYVHAPKTPEDPWEECKKVVDKFDEDLCQGWKDDLSTLLTFAGLLTAVVATFISLSYDWLVEDSQDTTNELLLRLIQEVSNSSEPSTSNADETPFSPMSSSVRINALWFLSITTSLSAALIGLLCQQWIRAYQRDASLSAKDSLRLRQMRFQGFEAWHVGHIIASLPIIIQASVWLFFAGMLDFLWTLNLPLIAIPSTIIVGISGGFAVCTTLVPAVHYLLNSWSITNVPDDHIKSSQDYYDGLRLSPCPYKSPQSWLCFNILYHTWRGISYAITSVTGMSPAAQREAISRIHFSFRVKFWNAVARALHFAKAKEAPEPGPPKHSSWLSLEHGLLERDNFLSKRKAADHNSVSKSFNYLQKGLVWTLKHLGNNKTVRQSALQWIISDSFSQQELQRVAPLLGTNYRARTSRQDYDQSRSGELVILTAAESLLKEFASADFIVEMNIRALNAIDTGDADNRNIVKDRLKDILDHFPSSLQEYGEIDILQQLMLSLHRLLGPSDSRSKLADGMVEESILPIFRRLYTNTTFDNSKLLDYLHSALLAWADDISPLREHRTTELARCFLFCLQMRDIPIAEPLVRYGRNIHNRLGQGSIDSLGPNWAHWFIPV